MFEQPAPGPSRGISPPVVTSPTPPSPMVPSPTPPSPILPSPPNQSAIIDGDVADSESLPGSKTPPTTSEQSSPSLDDSSGNDPTPTSSYMPSFGSRVVSRNLPLPKRMRPSEMSELYMYRDQETLRNAPRAEASSSSTSGSCHSRVPSSHHRNASSSNRWSIVKNVRDLTTGSLDLGALPVCVSPDIVDRFLEMSSSNSANKLETGGLLAGVIEESVRFKITTLIIPKQKGISDYWEALDPVEIQAFFTTNQLLLLGSIHTHPPPWTSYLSSVDLHQLFDFQKDNPSAVSIVVAPAHMPSNVPAEASSLDRHGSDCSC